MNTKRNVLIAYYSRTGSTARVAKELAARLGADVEEIHESADRQGLLGYLRAGYASMREETADISKPEKDPAGYTLLVVGTPVWGWRMTPAARAYLRAVKGRARSIAFFVTSGDTDVARIAPAMQKLAGQDPVATAGFNARELGDADRFGRKIEQFALALRSAFG